MERTTHRKAAGFSRTSLKILVAALVATFALVLPRPARAGKLGTDMIGMFQRRRRIWLRGFEKGADLQMVFAVAGATPARALPAIRKVFGLDGQRSQQPS